MRRWAERAVAAGVLTVDHLRSGAPAACTLPPGSNSRAPVSEPRKPEPVEPPERLDDAAELLDDLLLTLPADLPETWSDLAAALPDELYERIDSYLEFLLS
jgi:hypothetical protein